MNPDGDPRGIRLNGIQRVRNRRDPSRVFGCSSERTGHVGREFISGTLASLRGRFQLRFHADRNGAMGEWRSLFVRRKVWLPGSTASLSVLPRLCHQLGGRGRVWPDRFRGSCAGPILSAKVEAAIRAPFITPGGIIDARCGGTISELSLRYREPGEEAGRPIRARSQYRGQPRHPGDDRPR